MSTRERLDRTRSQLRRQIRRRRRPLAAVAAALAVVCALVSLRPPAPQLPGGQARSGTGLSAGEVAVPVSLGTAAMARALTIGGVIDLVVVAETSPPAARVVARDARVIALPDSGSAFSPSSSAVITVAVPEPAALDLIAANAKAPFAVLLHGTR